MEVLKLWDYQVWDGGSYHNHKAYFDRDTVLDDTARKFAGRFDYMREHEIVIYESIQEYHDAESGKLRKQALAKLTAAERKALGV